MRASLSRRSPPEHDQPGDQRREGGSRECPPPTPPSIQGGREGEGDRPRDTNARGMAGDRARHQDGIHPVGQELQPGHVRARPSHARQGASHHCAPEPIRQDGEAEMARHREGDAGQIDGARVDAIRQGDEDGHGQRVGRVEDSRDPARLTIAEVPRADEAREEGRPCVGADLGAYLGRAYAGDETGRRQRGQDALSGSTRSGATPSGIPGSGRAPRGTPRAAARRHPWLATDP